MLLASSLASLEDYQVYMNHILHTTKLTNQTTKILTYLYDGSRYFHLIQILAYNILSIHFLLKTKKSMSNSFSNLDKFQLRYFYIVTISFILLMSIPGFYITYIGRTPFVGNEFSLLYFSIIFTILYLILAIVGLKQIPVEKNISHQFKNTNSPEIHLDELKEIEISLLKYFKKEKPWLNPHLNIWNVAKSIGTNRSYVSKIINENLNCNFNQFVNDYRISEAKRLLKQQPQLSIAEISELSGFGSVNSFIRIFKMNNKCTPTQFKKK
ncbi:MAG: helix-turn-helix domain-containing protein [Lutibacter sp.]|uniref:AraC family transcriptional regulator n=1 Tax=Lutibacter sp. TaxID=1925666 RepID=UPI00385E33E3